MNVRLEVLDEGAMTAEQLKRNVDGGEVVEAKVGSQYVAVKLAIHPKTGSEVYAMWGPTGTHCLAASVTDADRLHAHWTGFVEANRIIAKLP